MTITMNHVHLGTKNLKVTQEFYGKYFGFKKSMDHGDGVFLTNDAGFMIAIDPVDELPILPDWYHLNFCVESGAQVEKIYSAMKTGKANIVRDLKTSTGEFASFFVKGPDGNKLEVSWHNE